MRPYAITVYYIKRVFTKLRCYSEQQTQFTGQQLAVPITMVIGSIGTLYCYIAN